ncbi:hypothetical protein NEHOM01_2531, partial [Nematocida homosporus]|uniref:uncharacterized protein n=1 Tax=Nematocida homosporus TaxID=1912981 RepID=UPI00221FA520
MFKITLTMEDIEQLTQYLQGDRNRPAGLSKLRWCRIQRIAGRFTIHGRKLHYISEQRKKGLKVIGNDDTVRLKNLIQAIHIKGMHASTKKIYKSMRKQYMGFTRQTILGIGFSCSLCQKSAPPKRSTPVQNIISKHPMEHLQIDCIDMCYCAEANDGYGWILTIIDTYSKYLVAMKMRRKTGESVVQCLEFYFMMLGCPRIVQSDNGSEFVNVEVKGLMKRLGIEYRHGRPRHPQSQGQVERANQTLTRSLFKNTPRDNPTRWIDVLNAVIIAYNKDWHRAINKAPIDVLYGYPASEPYPVLDDECQKAYDQEVDRIFRCEIEGDSPDNPVFEWNKPVEHPNIVFVPVKRVPVEERINPSYQKKYLTTMNRASNARIKAKEFASGDKVWIAM